MPLSGEASTNLQARPCSTRGWKGDDAASERRDTRAKQKTVARGAAREESQRLLVEGVCRRTCGGSSPGFRPRYQIVRLLPVHRAFYPSAFPPPLPPSPPRRFAAAAEACEEGKGGRVGRLLSATLHLILRALRRP